ncbi:hypothetical protein DUI87_18991 [Hirundo rustica rustica]|uniref:Peptidase A2 domain-containing protein n=1 Tax=Hirundo rustica rustica TaxID=333673 RepID=A0A3M0JT35_HIRRU|nr:hypothetical protein DUI87_18991 [Hirundo rustica rustica]
MVELLSPSLPERSPSFPAEPGCVPAAEPFDRSPAADAVALLAGSSPAEDAAGPAPVAGPAPPPLPAANVTAAAGAGVFKFSANGDTAGMWPVFDMSKGPCAVGSSSTAWTLPPCQVTVRPKDHGRFWGEVKAKAEGLSDGADAGAGHAVSGVQPVPSRVPASDPVGPTGQDMAGAAASSEGLQAFPVLQGATHNTYQPLAWQALTELRDAVGKYGLGSAEVMQVLCYFNASLLMPFDIRSLAGALFPPTEYDFFEHKWTQLTVRAVERNRTLGPGDPRRMDQCQQTGMASLVQNIQLATPQQSFATIVQGVDEPFLCFAGRLPAAVEKQFGKRDTEREGQTRADTNVSASAPTNGDLLSRLAASTRGSAGVDVCTAESVVFDSDKIHKVPLDAFGPLGDGMSAFLMGRSSATIQGIMVHLGLIDADFSGQIHAMVSTPTPPLTIPKGTRIAQLVPFKSSVSRTEDWCQGDSGFGSTGPPQARWTAVLTKDHPERLCTVSMAGATPSEIHLCGLLDTGADVSILSLAAWPPQWPLSLAKASIVSLGRTKQCYVSQNPVAIMNLEGQTAINWPHVTEIAQNLWGRDVLATWGVRLETDF